MWLYVPFFGESWGQRAPFRGLIMIASCECFYWRTFITFRPLKWEELQDDRDVVVAAIKSNTSVLLVGKDCPMTKTVHRICIVDPKRGAWKVEKCHKISCLIEACGRRESHDLKKSRDQWCSLLFAAKTTMNAVKDGITKSSTIDYIVKNGIRCTSDKYIKRIKPEHFKQVEVEWCERMELQV